MVQRYNQKCLICSSFRRVVRKATVYVSVRVRLGKMSSDRITIDMRGDNNWRITVPDDMKASLEGEAEERGMSVSQLARLYIQVGRKLYDLYDPRNGEKSPDRNNTEDTETPFRTQVPEGVENAISLDELVERVDDYIFDIVEEDPTLNRDGREVYKDGD